MEPTVLQAGRKAVLVVLFVPSVERDGITSIDQVYWVEAALDTFGQHFGGATAVSYTHLTLPTNREV